MKLSPAFSCPLAPQATLLGALLLAPARPAFGNTPPGAPYVIEPAVDGQVVSPFDHAGNLSAESEAVLVGVPCTRERDPHTRFESEATRPTLAAQRNVRGAAR